MARGPFHGRAEAGIPGVSDSAGRPGGVASTDTSGNTRPGDGCFCSLRTESSFYECLYCRLRIVLLWWSLQPLPTRSASWTSKKLYWDRARNVQLKRACGILASEAQDCKVKLCVSRSAKTPRQNSRLQSCAWKKLPWKHTPDRPPLPAPPLAPVLFLLEEWPPCFFHRKPDKQLAPQRVLQEIMELKGKCVLVQTNKQKGEMHAQSLHTLHFPWAI